MSLPPPIGNPPSIEWIAPLQLQIDPTYQRSAQNKGSRDHITRIAQEWDWRLCQPLSVSRRLPAADLFVIDGQHRLEAARLRGDITHLPCCITTFAGVAEEAHMFVAANRGRRTISRLDDHRAAVAAGDAMAIQVQDVITSAGLRVADQPNPKAWGPGEIGCLSGVRTALRQRGRPVVSAALVNLAEAFPDEPLLYAGTILGALYLVLATPPAGFDPDALFTALLTKSQADWVAAAGGAASGGTAINILRGDILAAYAKIAARAA